MNNSVKSLRGFFASLPDAPGDDQLLERFLSCRARADRAARAADRAFEAIVARHGAMVRGVCRRVLDDPGDADDAFQATFLVLLRRAASLRVAGSLGPWLHGVARRVALRLKAERARRAAREQQVRDNPAADPAAEASRAELLSVIDEEVSRLPARYRAAVVLCLLEGLPYAEAARRLACPVATVGVRLLRGRELLRHRLTRRGVTTAAAVLAAGADAVRAAAPRVGRSALDASRAPSPRAAALARQEVNAMLALKARVAAVVVAAAVTLAGVGWVAVGLQRPAAGGAAGTPTPSAFEVARADPEPAATPPPPPAEPPPEVPAIVDKHEAQLARVRTLTCAIEARVSDDGGKTWKTMSRTRVYRRGGEERVHVHGILVRDKDKIVPSRYDWDVCFTPDGLWSMAGYDPELPPHEPVTPARRVSGLIRPPQQAGPWGHKGALGADYLLLFLPDPGHSLRELCAATGQVTPAARRDDRGQTVWDLALKSPHGKANYVVGLSPAHGCAIVETQTVRTAQAATYKSNSRVLEFQEPAPGIFLPKTVRATMSWAPAIVVETVVRDVTVNGPVADANLAFRFPEGAFVNDVARGVFYVWGRDAPARTYKNVDDYNEWTRYVVTPHGTEARNGPLAERYEALSQEFERRARDVARSARDADSGPGRPRFDPVSYAARFVELAKENPTAPAALHALARAASLYGSPEAVELLTRHWAADARIGEVILPVGLVPPFVPGTETLLREVIARNPSTEAKGRATYALASVLFSIADLRHWQASSPAAAAALEHRFGKEALGRLLARDPDVLLREADELIARVVSKFADVKLHPSRPKETLNLGGLARSWIRPDDEPVVGRPAPALQGKDLDGKPVRLADYRGKVAVIVFWASWCRPCMAMMPEEKALARRMADKPFVLIGVNGDESATHARSVVAAQSLPWVNLHDGLPSEGKNAERYHVAGHGVPAVFVADREGVLRYKWVLSTEELERYVNTLLAEKPAAAK